MIAMMGASALDHVQDSVGLIAVHYNGSGGKGARCRRGGGGKTPKRQVTSGTLPRVVAFVEHILPAMRHDRCVGPVVTHATSRTQSHTHTQQHTHTHQTHIMAQIYTQG